MDNSEDEVFEDKETLMSVNDGNSKMDAEEISKIRHHTIMVMYFTMFVGSVSFSIVMSSLWPFLRRLDKDVTETFLGYVNAGYSLAQLLCSLLFGYWSDRRPSIEPLLLSILLLALGSGLYAYAEPFGMHGIWIVLCARILLGFSAGNGAVARAVAAHISTPEDLSKVMSYLALWQAIGFFVGPAFQAAAKPAGSKGFYVASIKFYFNIYTAPCYVMIVLSIINFALVMKYFVETIGDEKQRHLLEEKRIRRESKTFQSNDKLALVVCLIVYFVAMGVFALNETILSPIMMDIFAWSHDKTVFYGSILLSIAGVLAIICFLAIVPLSKRFNNKFLVLCGYLMLLAGFVIYLPWGPGHLKLKMANLQYPNGTDIHTGSGGAGCPYEYKWCKETPQLPLPQFIVAAFIVGIGYPIAVVLINVLYSQIVGPFPQGVYMGWFSGVGSLARVVGPLYVTVMYKNFGIRWTSVCTDATIGFAIILFLIFWRRMKPYDDSYHHHRTPSMIA